MHWAMEWVSVLRFRFDPRHSRIRAKNDHGRESLNRQALDRQRLPQPGRPDIVGPCPDVADDERTSARFGFARHQKRLPDGSLFDRCQRSRRRSRRAQPGGNPISKPEKSVGSQRGLDVVDPPLVGPCSRLSGASRPNQDLTLQQPTGDPSCLYSRHMGTPSGFELFQR